MAIKTLTKDIFDAQVLGTQETVLVEFSAPWCGYCRRIAPALQTLSESLAGKVTVGAVDIDEEPELTERYEVETIPAMLLFKAGSLTGEPLVAPESRGRIEAWLKENGAI